MWGLLHAYYQSLTFPLGDKKKKNLALVLPALCQDPGGPLWQHTPAPARLSTEICLPFHPNWFQQHSSTLHSVSNELNKLRIFYFHQCSVFNGISEAGLERERERKSTCKFLLPYFVVFLQTAAHDGLSVVLGSYYFRLLKVRNVV